MYIPVHLCTIHENKTDDQSHWNNNNNNNANNDNNNYNNNIRSTLSSLPTETVYGFLNFTTTMQDKIMVFTSQPSASTGKHNQ